MILTGKHHFHRFLISKFANKLQIVLADRSDEIEAIKKEYEKEIKSWKELAELKVKFFGNILLENILTKMKFFGTPPPSPSIIVLNPCGGP